MSEKPNLWEPISAICEALGVEPSLVRRMSITHRTAEVELFLLNEQGSKYVHPIGEPATETKRYEIKTYPESV